LKQDVFSIGLQLRTKPDWDGSDRPSSLALAFKCHVVEASPSLAFELYGCLEFAGVVWTLRFSMPWARGSWAFLFRPPPRISMYRIWDILGTNPSYLIY